MRLTLRSLDRKYKIAFKSHTSRIFFTLNGAALTKKIVGGYEKSK